MRNPIEQCVRIITFANTEELNSKKLAMGDLSGWSKNPD
jgi:hypothetical protein